MEMSLPSDYIEEKSDIVEELEAIRENDRFSEFKSAFFDRFITKKQTFKGKDYYLNYCFYNKGKFNMKYVINNKKYKTLFSMSELSKTDEGKRFFVKLFYIDEKLKSKDKLMQDLKPDIFYYKFNFFIFKALICRYLYVTKFEKEENIWESDLNLFILLKDQKFMELVDRFDLSSKTDFYKLIY